MMKGGVTILWVPLFLLLWWGPAVAQPKVQTIVPRHAITVGHSFQVQYIVQDLPNFKALQPPDFGADFLLVSGPGIYEGAVTINGVPTSIQNYSYTLMPLRIGKLAIKGATVTYKGGKVKAPDTFVTTTYPVTTGGGTAWSNNLTQGEIEKKLEQHLFIQAVANKKEVYIGEPVVAAFDLFSNVISASEVVKNPGFYGFTVVDLPLPETGTQVLETKGGITYDKHNLRKVQLYPMQSGELLIDEVKVNNLVTVADGITGAEKEVEVLASSRPITIQVKPLPDKGKPDEFSGAVGDFAVQATVAQRQLRAGTIGRLQVTVSGKGNFLQINAPEVRWPRHMEGFEPKVTESLQKDKIPINGFRKYDYTFTVDSAGKYAIPPVALYFFNPVTNRYHTAVTDTLFVTVAPQNKLALIFKKNNQGNEGSNKGLLWLGALSIAAIGASVWMIQKRKGKRITAATPVNNNKTDYVATIQAIRGADKAAFLQLQQALYSYLKETYHIHTSVKASLAEQLAATPMSRQEQQAFQNLLDTCTTVQYYGAGPEVSFAALQQSALILVQQTSQQTI